MTRHRGRAWLVVLALALAGLPGPPAVAASPDELARPTSTRGSWIDFHGWSKNGRFLAYTRRRLGRTRPDQRMHRRVEHGSFNGFGTMVGGDVESFAREHGYVVVHTPKRRAGEATIEYRLGGSTLTLEIQVGRAQTWRLMRGERVLAEQSFDRIYVGFEADLYPTPDERQAVLVMHLDTGWEIDAAIFPVSLADEPSRAP